MAAECRHFHGQLAAWHAATILSPIVRQPIDPVALNPFREVVPLTKAAERLAKWKRGRRWKGFLKSISGGKWKG